MSDLAGIAERPDTGKALVPPGRDITSGRLLVRNTFWNFGGMALPMLAAVVSIPFLTRGLGTDQFGVLTLSWVVIGQLTLFDLGLGRALTKLVAERIGARQEHAIPPLFWASFLLTLLLGVAGGVVFAGASSWLVRDALKIPVAIRPDTLKVFYLIAVTMPVVISSIALRGFVEGCQRFDLLNAVRIPVSLFSYLAPLVALRFSHRLLPVIVVLILGRWLGWIAQLWICFRVMPALYYQRSPEGAPLREMFSLGGWMTATNFIGPLIASLDRFVIAAMLSVTAVAYFATPDEVVTRLLIIPGALVGVLFPAFSASLAQETQRNVMLFDRSLKYVVLLMFPIVLLLVGFGREGVGLWLGRTFADNSVRVMQWLSIAVFLNSVGFVPCAQVQGAGRPDITAKLYLLELPVFALGLWWLIRVDGIVGASLAWLLRSGIDSLLLLFATAHILPESRTAVRRLSGIMLTCACLLAVPVFLPALRLRMAYVIIVGTAFSALGWSYFLTSHERSFVYRWLDA
jgi:O-antigen/teichoic acid export membrane protein